MFNKSDLIFRFREGHIDLLWVSAGYKNINILKTLSLNTESNPYSEQDSFINEALVADAKNFIKGNGIKANKTKVIINLDGIITRLVECPKMSKKDMDRFIQNNIREYFTVNLDDYFYDYKIVDIEKDKVKKMNILLVVFPKAKLLDIADYIKTCGFSVERFIIYPDSIANTFKNIKEDSVVIFEVGRERNNITILDKGKVFLYSASSIMVEQEEDYEEIVENMGYFLNFYSARHFGTSVNSMYLIGELGENENLYNLIKEQFPKKIHRGINLNDIKIACQTGGSHLYYDVIGLYSDKKNIYNKQMDFNKVIASRKRSGENAILIKFAVAVALISLLANVSMKAYIELSKRKYNSVSIEKQLANLTSIEKEYNEATAVNNGINEKISFAKSIESKKLNYVGYLELIKKNLPSNTSIKRITVEVDLVTLEVNINNSTLDKLNVIIAINNTKVFEPIDLDSIKLDNSETELNLQLKIKNPI